MLDICLKCLGRSPGKFIPAVIMLFLLPLLLLANPNGTATKVGDETCATCPGDCGNCVCTGHTDCLTREDLQLCPTLCHGCGDGHCAGAEGESNAGAEDCRTCPEDCGVCFCHNLPQDGQGSCSEFDGYEQCPLLCFCGNVTCDMDEDHDTCPTDCPN